MSKQVVADYEHRAALVLEAVCRLGTDDQFLPHSVALILSQWADQFYLMEGNRNTAYIAMLRDVAKALEGKI